MPLGITGEYSCLALSSIGFEGRLLVLFETFPMSKFVTLFITALLFSEMGDLRVEVLGEGTSLTKVSQPSLCRPEVLGYC